MANEQDPCELYPEAEVEEEVDPEFEQSAFPGFGGSGIGNAAAAVRGFTEEEEEQPEVFDFVGPSAAEQVEGLTQFGDDGQLENGFIAELLEKGRIAASEDRQNILNENLEDAVLTPLYQNYLAAGRSTWLFKNNSSMYSGRIGELFTSKPKHHLAIQAAPLTEIVRAPISVQDPTYRTDSFRWFSDKLWVNAEDLAGPQE